jgi:hypothetical protein
MDRITNQSPRQQGYGSTSSLRNDSLKHTRKHERKEGGIEQRNKAARHWRTIRPGGADCPQGPHEQSAKVPRTVRSGTADRPAWGGLSIKANRTSSSEPRKTDRSRGARGPSAGHPRTVRTSAADRPKPRPTKTQNQNESKAKQSKNTKNTRRTLLLRTVRHHLADCPRLTNRGKNCSTPKINFPKSSPDLPNGRSC